MTHYLSLHVSLTSLPVPQLMFNNCRQYNEEGSVIYEDANVLERALMAKVRQLGPLPAHDGVANKPRVLRYGGAGGIVGDIGRRAVCFCHSWGSVFREKY